MQCIGFDGSSNMFTTDPARQQQRRTSNPPIPLPESYLVRTESELQLEYETNVADWREYLMYRRIASRKRWQQNQAPERVNDGEQDHRRKSSPQCVSAAFYDRHERRSDKQACDKQQMSRAQACHGLPSKGEHCMRRGFIPEYACEQHEHDEHVEDDYGQFQEFPSLGTAPKNRVYYAGEEGLCPSFHSLDDDYSSRQSNPEEEEEGVFVLDM